MNLSALVTTALEQSELRARLKEIEANQGRDRDRTPSIVPIDIDIIRYDDEPLDPSVTQRAYVAVPSAELVPTWAREGRTVGEWASALRLSNPIEPVGSIWPIPR